MEPSCSSPSLGSPRNADLNIPKAQNHYPATQRRSNNTTKKTRSLKTNSRSPKPQNPNTAPQTPNLPAGEAFQACRLSELPPRSIEQRWRCVRFSALFADAAGAITATSTAAAGTAAAAAAAAIATAFCKGMRSPVIGSGAPRPLGPAPGPSRAPIWRIFQCFLCFEKSPQRVWRMAQLLGYSFTPVKENHPTCLPRGRHIYIVSLISRFTIFDKKDGHHDAQSFFGPLSLLLFFSRYAWDVFCNCSLLVAIC